MQFKLFSLIALSTVVIPAPFPAFEWMLERGGITAAETAELLAGEGRAASGGLTELAAETPAHTLVSANLAKEDPTNWLVTKMKTVYNGYAIQEASANGQFHAVRLLLESKEVEGEVVNSALRKASSNGHTDIVNLILNSDKVISSAGFRYAIEDAAENGHTAVVELFLNSKKVSYSQFRSAIQAAAINGHTAVVELLLNSKKLTSDDYITAIYYASRGGHIDVVKLFLNSEQVPANNFADSIGVASEMRHTELLKLLVSSDKAVSSAYNLYNSVAKAAREGDIAVIEVFLNADKITSDDFKNAIYAASSNGHTEIVKLLLNFDKAIPSVSGHSFQFAKDIANERGYHDIVRLLQQYQMTHVERAINKNMEVLKIAPSGNEGAKLAIPVEGDPKRIEADDAACFICMKPYEDGADLGLLKCNHHADRECLKNWLHVRNICPMCTLPAW